MQPVYQFHGLKHGDIAMTTRIDRTVQLVKREILEDIRAGLLPTSISNLKNIADTLLSKGVSPTRYKVIYSVSYSLTEESFNDAVRKEINQWIQSGNMELDTHTRKKYGLFLN